MNNKILVWLAAGAVVVGLAAGLYLWQQNTKPPAQVLESIQPPPPPAAPADQAEPAISHPIPENDSAQAAAKPLPALDQSDQTLWAELQGLVGLHALKSLFNSEHIVRNIVVTIDNLPRKTAAVRLLPTKPVGGAFATTGQGDSIAIAAENAARYKPYVRLAEAVDTKKLVALYVGYYPLFQRAYQELGYPKGYFNDRLVKVIDHLLEAPEIDGPVKLVQPHVLYKYEDPELEAASAGHKVMMRMGRENEAKVKAKLRDIRRELTRQSVRK